MAETKLGFEGLVETTEEDTTGYTVNFSSTERESPEAPGAHEEITLIDTVESSRSQLSPDEKVSVFQCSSTLDPLTYVTTTRWLSITAVFAWEPIVLGVSGFLWWCT
jgi:hypothetical protein